MTDAPATMPLKRRWFPRHSVLLFGSGGLWYRWERLERGPWL